MNALNHRQARDRSLDAWLIKTQTHRRTWKAEDLVDYFDAYLQMKSASGLQKVIETLNRLNLRRSAYRDLVKSKSPSASVLRELFFSIDVAMILMERRRGGSRTPNEFRYYIVDSSPQGNNNWLLSKSTFVDVASCAEAAAHANNLINLAAGLVNCRSDSEAAGVHSAQLRAILLTLEQGMIDRTGVPVAIGLSHVNTAHKAAAFFHSVMLETSCAAFKQSRLHTISFTGDLGVEIGIPGFRSTVEVLLPAWLQQQLLELESLDEGPGRDGKSSASAASADISSTFGSDCDVFAVNSASALQVDAAGGSAPERAFEVDGDELATSRGLGCRSVVAAGQLQPDSLLKEAWLANPSWHSILLPFAIPVPGMLHIASNLLEDVDTGMTYWSVFWEQLANVGALLSSLPRLEKFRAKCIDLRHADAVEAIAMFSAKIDKLYSKRWGSVSHFVRRCAGRLPMLKIFWDANLYMDKSDKEDAMNSRFSPKDLTATLNDNKFWAYCGMVQLVHAAVDELAGWSEGCLCHPPWLGSASSGSYAVGMKTRLRQKLLDGRRSCPMQGRRAPELACGVWKQFSEKLLQQTFHQLSQVHQHLLKSSLFAMFDLSKVVSCKS